MAIRSPVAFLRNWILRPTADSRGRVANLEQAYKAAEALKKCVDERHESIEQLQERSKAIRNWWEKETIRDGLLQATGMSIESAMREGNEPLAVELFRRFRRHSPRTLPQALPAIAALARCKPAKDDPVRSGPAYVEYLVSAPSGTPDYRAVEQRLQELCQADSRRSTALNEMAWKAGHFGWASANLGRMNLHRRNFEAALQSFEQARGPMADVPAEVSDLENGQALLGVGRYDDAIGCFATSAQRGEAGAQELLVVAKVMKHDAHAARADNVHSGRSVEDLHQELSQLRRGGILFPCWTTPVHLSLGRRFKSLNETLRELLESPCPVGDLPELRDEVFALISDAVSELPVAPDSTLGIERRDSDFAKEALSLRAHRMLELGQLTPLRQWIGDPLENEDELLRCDYLICLGRATEGRAALANVYNRPNRMRLALALELRCSLASRSSQHVLRVLRSDRGNLLPGPLRSVLAAEAYEGAAQWRQALDSVREATALAPLSSRVWSAVGHTLLCLALDRHAKIAFAHALRLSPNNVWAGIGEALIDGSQGSLKRVAGLEPRYEELLPAISTRLRAAGRTDLAAVFDPGGCGT